MLLSLASFLMVGALYSGKVLATECSRFFGHDRRNGTVRRNRRQSSHGSGGLLAARLKTQGQSDLFVQSNKWDAGGSSGWHTHPGPSLIIITAGLVTAYESDDDDCTSSCLRNRDTAGQHVHRSRRRRRARPAQRDVERGAWVFGPDHSAIRPERTADQRTAPTELSVDVD